MWHMERAGELAKLMDQVNLGDLVVDTDDKAPEAIAEEVWQFFRGKTGWLWGQSDEGDGASDA